ncbi:MAG TPA: M20/M25/M40 family metallo-hydrolase, partial [Alphaproteobacteria bacterium]|nr:M20/M25/M40 family metallo-hydrolase [Alphaproteobacteria bacterium]
AITHAARIIGYIEKEAAARKAAPILGSPFTPPWTTYNIGTIQGGSALNIIARECSFLWEFRTHPGDDPIAIRDRIARFVEEDVVPKLEAEHPDGAVDTVRIAAVPMLRPETDGPAEALARRLTGANATGVVAFATEGGVFQAAGLSTVVCGPGDIAQAHQPDEFISLDQLAQGEAFLRKVADWAAG